MTDKSESVVGSQVSYIFDRYVTGIQMAEGCRINKAKSVEEAIQMAIRLFSDCPGSEFRLVETVPQPLPSNTEMPSGELSVEEFRVKWYENFKTGPGVIIDEELQECLMMDGWANYKLRQARSESASAVSGDAAQKFPSGEAMCGSLELLGIIWHEDMVEEGEPWEVIAEPEPQFFETLDEAVDFYRKLQDNPERTLSSSPQPPSEPRAVDCQCGDGGCIACWPSNFTRKALIEYVKALRGSSTTKGVQAQTAGRVPDEVVKTAIAALKCSHDDDHETCTNCWNRLRIALKPWGVLQPAPSPASETKGDE